MVTMSPKALREISQRSTDFPSATPLQTTTADAQFDLNSINEHSYEYQVEAEATSVPPLPVTFGDLPQELQDVVWEEALNSEKDKPRIIELHNHDLRPYNGEVQVAISSRYPAVFYVCHTSRERAMRMSGGVFQQLEAWHPKSASVIEAEQEAYEQRIADGDNLEAALSAISGRVPVRIYIRPGVDIILASDRFIKEENSWYTGISQQEVNRDLNLRPFQLSYLIPDILWKQLTRVVVTDQELDFYVHKDGSISDLLTKANMTSSMDESFVFAVAHPSRLSIIWQPR